MSPSIDGYEGRAAFRLILWGVGRESRSQFQWAKLYIKVIDPWKEINGDKPTSPFRSITLAQAMPPRRKFDQPS